MTAEPPEPIPRRYRSFAQAVARLWRLSPPLTVVWLGSGFLGPLLPLGVTVASGRVVGAVPDVVTAGFGSPAGSRLVRAIVAMAVLSIASLIIDSARWRAGDVLGHRLRADQRQRVMTAMLGRKGIGHADDPEVQDAAAAADNQWLRGVPEGLMNVTGIRIMGYGGALLVARHEPLAAAVLSIVWFIGGRWKWKRAVQDTKANLGRVRELRQATATAEVATSP